MRLPMLSLICFTTSWSRTVKRNFSATVPGSVTIAISPSQVLQTQPLRENFCTKPARSPSEYDQWSVSQVKPEIAHMDSQPLAGRTVAVPETRELEVFASLLERRGASVLRCPLVAIRDAPDPAPVLAFARVFAAQPPDDLILTTGEGLRRILGCIARH